MAIKVEGKNNVGFYKLTKYVMNALAQKDNDSASIEYFDLDRIFYTCEGKEYTIRMWNIFQNGNVDFTVYEREGDSVKDIYKGYFVYNEN